MTCPTPTAGTVTGQAGLTGLVDAYGQKQGAAFQWQYWAALSTKTGACAHYRANQTVTNEKWLLVTLLGSRDPMDNGTCPLPAVPADPGYLEVPFGPNGSPDAWHDTAGNMYLGRATYAVHSSNCRQTANDLTGAGWVRYTALTDTLMEGSYSLPFAAGVFTGSFSAPYCVLCDPRPAKVACVAA